eukprot:TRINITY_DN456_c0_g1_i1.p1 TRINITY_DN456_c0_g1~~TRINITY_DN456_c0_g1_i1.p1  ORF type:complete len:855 (-),score=233.22 TRINITY_DN456_c0_g1_i1:89-2653(-)
MDFTQLLLAAQSRDGNARASAEQQLKAFEAQNLPQLLKLLAFELANPEKPAETRTLAGLILKNNLDAKDENIREQKTQFWMGLDKIIKKEIKDAALQTLGDMSKDARSTAAQVVSRIACIELPRREWPELIEILLKNMVSPNTALKQSTLETLGYICEDTEQSAIREQSNQILTAVIQGMRKEETSDEVRLAGASALLGALEFVKSNFDKEVERNYIMQQVCEASQSTNEQVRVVAMQCLVKIGHLYYDKLSAYMQTLFNITIEIMNKDQEPVALQAIEFWATVCDVEIDIIIDTEECAMMKIMPERTCQHFIKGAVRYLVPVLCDQLTKQEDDQEEDAWNVATAAGNCLSLIASTVTDEIVQYVMPFVQKNIAQQDWHLREAAVLAFGSILEGPRAPMIKELVKEAATPNVLLSKLKDPVVLVRDTTAWTLGRICQYHPVSIVSRLNDIVSISIQALSDEPRVASKICWAIHNLAEAYEDYEETGTTALSPYFAQIMETLLRTTDRDDADESYLRASAYECMNVMIQNSGQDVQKMVVGLVPVYLERLQNTFNVSVLGGADKETLCELQGHLCGALRACTLALNGSIKNFADRMMECFLHVFETKTASVHEEALMAVGSVANAVDADFIRYMNSFHKWLEFALGNWEEHQVCSVAVGVVGDICRAIGEQMINYSDGVITLLLDNLRNPNINRDVKPPILACFGDIALAIGGKFDKYLSVVMSMLQQASGTVVKDMSDYDFVDYVNQLREDIFEAYTSIIQGLRTDNKADLFLPYVEQVLTFVDRVWNDNSRNDAVTRGAVGVLGDLGHSLGGKVRNYLHNPLVNAIINETLSSSNHQTKDVANWAKGVIAGLG